MKLVLVIALLVVTILLAFHVSAQWNKPVARVIPEAGGYASIPNAAVPRTGRSTAWRTEERAALSVLILDHSYVVAESFKAEPF